MIGKIIRSIATLAISRIGSGSTPTVSPLLSSFRQESIRYNKAAMGVLAGWAVPNIVASSVLIGKTEHETKAFHQMNAGWNLVNLAIASIAYIKIDKDAQKRYSLSQTVAEQQRYEKLYLLNTGLDTGYIAGGLYMRERGKRTNDEKLKGLGKSIIVQGAFLLLFDATMYLIQNRHSKKNLYPFIK
ncbi:hypothetical protein V6R21_06665 [Limibacter armeniacum]|uniref:DUF6992 family protein n=1 Tax=Limibacter armeniacum TaxID=466084 RepID=UPI002FE69874